MEKYNPTATLLLDTRKSKANGKYPLKLTIYCRPEKRRYRTGFDLTEDEWVKLNNQRLKDDKLKETKIKINAILNKAVNIIDNLSPFSFPAFETSMFISAVGKFDLSLEYWFNEYANLLEAQGREGTRISYNTTYNSLNRFKKNLKLTDITKNFLEQYEAQMAFWGKSSSTIGIYLRQLRAIINRAIEKGILKQENYPYKGFEIPAARNIKKTLTDEQLQLLLNYTPVGERNAWALDFWVFSYLCNGMNFTDIAHLTPDKVNGNFLHFFRRKTIRTKKKDLRPIKVPLHPRAQIIIDKWKNKSDENPYLFQILDAGLSPKTIKHRIQKFIKRVNDSMDKIKNDLGFDVKLGTYVARHSFCSRLMRKGASTQYIKECLGHSSVSVTENYLGDFAESVKQGYSILLTDFS